MKRSISAFAAVLRFGVVFFAGAQQLPPEASTLDQTQQQLMSTYRAKHRSCYSDSRKCRAVCERANELQDAADSLSRCAAQHDYSDDCGSRAHEVRDAADEYETAVSDSERDCR